MKALELPSLNINTMQKINVYSILNYLFSRGCENSQLVPRVMIVKQDRNIHVSRSKVNSITCSFLDTA